MNHVSRSCYSSKKKNHNSNTNKNFYHSFLPTMCQAVDALPYKCPDSHGGGYGGTDESGIKTLLPFKYFKPYYLRVTLPPFNWFHPSFKSLNWSLEKSVSWEIVHLPRVMQLCFIIGYTGRGKCGSLVLISELTSILLSHTWPPSFSTRKYPWRAQKGITWHQ